VLERVAPSAQIASDAPGEHGGAAGPNGERRAGLGVGRHEIRALGPLGRVADLVHAHECRAGRRRGICRRQGGDDDEPEHGKHGECRRPDAGTPQRRGEVSHSNLLAIVLETGRDRIPAARIPASAAR
jgi:hypothetical protein